MLGARQHDIYARSNHRPGYLMIFRRGFLFLAMLEANRFTANEILQTMF